MEFSGSLLAEFVYSSSRRAAPRPPLPRGETAPFCQERNHLVAGRMDRLPCVLTVFGDSQPASAGTKKAIADNPTTT